MDIADEVGGGAFDVDDEVSLVYEYFYRMAGAGLVFIHLALCMASYAVNLSLVELLYKFSVKYFFYVYVLCFIGVVKGAYSFACDQPAGDVCNAYQYMTAYPVFYLIPPCEAFLRDTCALFTLWSVSSACI